MQPLLCTAKTAELLNERVPRTRFALPVLVTLKSCAALVVLTPCDPKANVVGNTVA